MNRVAILITSFLSVFISFQLVAQTGWPARYNGPANKFDGARAIAIDDQDNVYVTGPSEGKKGNFDYVTIKYSASGTFQWASRYNGAGNGEDRPNAIVVKNGFVYVTGRSMGSGNLDFATVKYDATNGAQAWVARANINNNDVANDLAVDDAGNVFVTGFSGGTSQSNGAIFTTIKYNSDSVQQWIDNIPASSANVSGANSLVLDGTGNVYVAGSIGTSIVVKYNDLGMAFNKEWQTSFTDNAARKILRDANGDLIVCGWGDNFETVKLDQAGNITGQYSYPGAGSAWDMALDALGNIYLTGIKMGQPDGSNDYSTAKYSPTGQPLWLQYYRTSTGGRDHARAIALDAAGNVFVTGFSELVSGRTFNSNYATVKYDNNGSQQWARLYDGPEKSVDEGFALAVDASGNVFVTGQSHAKTSYFDIVTLRYDADPPAANKSDEGREVISNPTGIKFNNYPNPFSRTSIIEYNLSEGATVRLSVHDLSGKQIALLVNEARPAGVHRVQFNINNLPAGTYLYTIRAGRFIQTKYMVCLK